MPCYQANPKLAVNVTGPCILYFDIEEPAPRPGDYPVHAYFFVQGNVSDVTVPDPSVNRFKEQATLRAGVTLKGAFSTGLGLKTEGGQILFGVYVNATDLDSQGITPCDIPPWA